MIAGCRGARVDTPTPMEIVETIYLIGDAGEPDPRLPATVLDSLTVQAAATGAKGTILFLGDNVYPSGSVEPGEANYADALRHYPRYLRAMTARVERLGDLARDRELMDRVEELQQAWQHRVDALPEGRPPGADLRRVRWMLEEYRVSLWAQHLGTAQPVSDARIRKALG